MRIVYQALRALGRMVLIELSLRTSDLPTTCRRLGVRFDLDSAAPPAAERAVLPPELWATVRACRAVLLRWPAGDTCLRRCLLVGHRVRRLRPVLRIGVRRGDDGAFAAHSWLEIDGRTLDPTAAGYSTLGQVG